MKKHSKYLANLRPVLYEKFDHEKAEHIVLNAGKIYERLCLENGQEPRALRMLSIPAIESYFVRY